MGLTWHGLGPSRAAFFGQSATWATNSPVRATFIVHPLQARTPRLRPSGLPSVGREPKGPVSLHFFGVRLLCSARQPPPSTADSSRYRGELLCTYFPSCFSALDMKQIPPKFSYMLDARQGSGYVLVECKRPAPKEWSKTAKRFKACDRLRAPQRGAAMEPGHARIAAGHGTTISWDIARCPPINNKSPLTLQ